MKESKLDKIEKVIRYRLGIMSPSSRGLHFRIMSDDIKGWCIRHNYPTTDLEDGEGIMWTRVEEL